MEKEDVYSAKQKQQKQKMTISQHIVFRIINYILLIVAFLILVWFLNSFVRNSAIDGCARNATYTQNVPNENATVTFPITDLYNRCLQDKGVK